NHRRYQRRRAHPVELVIWRVVASIIVVKREDDGDLHIVLQGASGATCVAEAPTPRPPFVDSTSPWLARMAERRQKIADSDDGQCAGVPFVQVGKYLMPRPSVAAGVPPGPPRTLGPGESIFDLALPFSARVAPTPAEVTGVGFFDRVHGQTGVAPDNGIELHPILVTACAGA